MLLNPPLCTGELPTQSMFPTQSKNSMAPRLRHPDVEQVFSSDSGHKVYVKDLL